MRSASIWQVLALWSGWRQKGWVAFTVFSASYYLASVKSFDTSPSENPCHLASAKTAWVSLLFFPLHAKSYSFINIHCLHITEIKWVWYTPTALQATIWTLWNEESTFFCLKQKSVWWNGDLLNSKIARSLFFFFFKFPVTTFWPLHSHPLNH